MAYGFAESGDVNAQRNALAQALMQQQADMYGTSVGSLNFGPSGGPYVPNYAGMAGPSVGGEPGGMAGAPVPGTPGFMWGGSTNPNADWKQGAPEPPVNVNPPIENVPDPGVRPFSENVPPDQPGIGVRPFNENVPPDTTDPGVRPFSENVPPDQPGIGVRPFNENVPPDTTEPTVSPELSPADRVNQQSEGQIQVPPSFFEDAIGSPGFNFLGTPVGEFGTGAMQTGNPGSQLGGSPMNLNQGGWGFMGNQGDLNLFRGAVPDQLPVEIPYTNLDPNPSDLIAGALAAQTFANAPLDLSFSPEPYPDVPMESLDVPSPAEPDVAGAPSTTGIVGLLGGAPDLTGADIGGGLGIGLGSAGAMAAAADAAAAAGLTGGGDAGIGLGAAGTMGAAADAAAGLTGGGDIGGGPGLGLGAAGTMGAASDAAGLTGGDAAGAIGLGAAGAMAAAADAAAGLGLGEGEGAGESAGDGGGADGAGDE